MQWFGTDRRSDDDSATRTRTQSRDAGSQTDSTVPQAAMVVAGAIALTGASLACYHVYRRYLRRYPTINHLPAQIYSADRDGRGLLGYVTSVGDGDNFRFFHTPGGRLMGWGWLRRVPTERKDLKDQTIHVRIAGVDAPELAHFGKPAQPFGKEALAWLTAYTIGKRVRVYVRSRDRFDRVVANPRIRTWPAKWIARDVGLEQVRAGLATVFREGGAEYGGMLAKLEQAEKEAKRAKRGMWARGKKLETPAEYKRRTRAGDDTPQKDSPHDSRLGKASSGGVSGWVKWALGRP
ncbi:putative endonuclease lcl3 [Savitreella phatthalungensis]